MSNQGDRKRILWTDNHGKQWEVEEAQWESTLEGYYFEGRFRAIEDPIDEFPEPAYVRGLKRIKEGEKRDWERRTNAGANAGAKQRHA